MKEDAMNPDGVAYLESIGSLEPWAGAYEGLPPPSKRKPPKGPVRTTLEEIDAALARAKAVVPQPAESDIVILQRKYKCSECGGDHTKATHRKPCELEARMSSDADKGVKTTDNVVIALRRSCPCMRCLRMRVANSNLRRVV